MDNISNIINECKEILNETMYFNEESVNSNDVIRKNNQNANHQEQDVKISSIKNEDNKINEKIQLIRKTALQAIIDLDGEDTSGDIYKGFKVIWDTCDKMISKKDDSNQKQINSIQKIDN